ncbi:hypothetical protein [Pseudoalteromonas prydzensis]|uniref:hypothetical protein n=1 Tax=Pseudoalteromonas prydzensis TaxID=182141 RepID=UPI0007E50150|nr:hypothetical protein [Pseudoalteromonas prydzensis]MBE0377171.1 hypothetical protein [Pseudoalteromonas prydzensis ACAM 620]
MDFNEFLETLFLEAYKSGRVDGQDGVFIKPEVVFKNYLKNFNKHDSQSLHYSILEYNNKSKDLH